jgi:hypothetical protein
MVEAFVKCGPVDEVLEKLEPFWEMIDSLCPMTPYRDLTMEQLTMYNSGLYAMVAEAKRRQAGLSDRFRKLFGRLTAEIDGPAAEI